MDGAAVDSRPQLKPLAEGSDALFWEDPNIGKKYDRLIVLQPEIFIHPDSKYKGIKPDQAKVLADTFQEQFATRILDSYPVVDQPGPTTAVVRFAIVDVYLKKAGFRPRNITPIGLAAYGLKNALGKGVSLIEATLEAEVLDSETGERIAVLVQQKGQHKDKEQQLKQEKTSWDELAKLLNEMAVFAVARMDWLQGTIR